MTCCQPARSCGLRKNSRSANRPGSQRVAASIPYQFTRCFRRRSRCGRRPSALRLNLDFIRNILKSAPVFARCRKILVIAALVFSMGLHWAALQTVAWTTMFAASITCESFSESVSQTFDGEHPCLLCKAVRAGKDSEQKSDAVTFKVKLECPPPADQFILLAPERFAPDTAEQFSADSFSSKPPLPPPRDCLV